MTCQAGCDVHPSNGALPPQCQPYAKRFGNSPTRSSERPNSMPSTVGILISTRCRCTAPPSRSKTCSTPQTCVRQAGPDASYAMDAPPEDSTVAAELRAKGAIIYAKANLAEYNAGGGNPGGARAGSRTFGAGARSSWAGTSCNVYDTARETGGSSSGSPCRSALISPPVRSVRRLADRAGSPPGETASSASSRPRV